MEKQIGNEKGGKSKPMTDRERQKIHRQKNKSDVNNYEIYKFKEILKGRDNRTKQKKERVLN